MNCDVKVSASSRKPEEMSDDAMVIWSFQTVMLGMELASWTIMLKATFGRVLFYRWLWVSSRRLWIP